MSFHFLLTSFIFAVVMKANQARKVEIDTFIPHSDFDPNYIDYGTLRVAKRGRNLFVLLGEFTFNTNWGNEIVMTVEITNKDLDLQMYKKSKPMCDFINEDKVFYADLRKTSNFPAQGSCPIAKGNYRIIGYKFPTEKVPQGPLGKYESKVIFSVGGKNVAGYTLWTTLKP